MRCAAVVGLAALLIAGCFPGITLDTPVRFSVTDWNQDGGSPARTHRSAGTIEPPLELYWEQTTNGSPTSAAPLVSGGNVYVSSTVGGIEIFNVLTGEQHGDIPIKAAIHGTPAAKDHYLVLPLAHAEPSLLCIDGTAARLYWQKNLKPVEAPLLLMNDVVIAATTAGGVHCFRIPDSAEVWTVDLPKAVYAAPAATDTLVFVGCADGDVYALSLATGRQRWRVPTGKPVLASPVCIQGSVIAANSAGDLVCVSQTDGAIRWRAGLGHPVYAGLAADDSCVFILVADRTIRALRLVDGTEKWNIRCAGLPSAAPLIIGKRLVTVSFDGTIAILDTEDGSTQWSVNADSRISCPPVFADGILLVCTEGRSLLAYGRRKTP